MRFATLAHEDRGNGPAIVFLHGHPFSRAMWASQLETLSDEFRVVAPDLPGYGESATLDQIMSMRRFADAVVRLIRNEDERRRIERAARNLVVQRYDWAAVARDFEAALGIARGQVIHRMSA